jgi:hypothetical protein
MRSTGDKGDVVARLRQPAADVASQPSRSHDADLYDGFLSCGYLQVSRWAEFATELSVIAH